MKVFVDFLFDDVKLLLKNKQKCKNHTLFMTKMATINTPFMTKTDPLGSHMPIEPI